MFVRQMVVHQLLDEYRKDGYEIKEQYPIGKNLRADVYAVKDFPSYRFVRLNSLKIS